MALKPKLRLNDSDPLRLATRKLLKKTFSGSKASNHIFSPLLTAATGMLHLLFQGVLSLAPAMEAMQPKWLATFQMEMQLSSPPAWAQGTDWHLSWLKTVSLEPIDVSACIDQEILTVKIHIKSLKFWWFLPFKTGRKLRIASATTSTMLPRQLPAS